MYKLKRLLLVFNALWFPFTAEQIPVQATPSTPTSQPAVSHRIGLDPLSVRSLLLGLYAKGEFLGTGTGFVVQKGANNYLVTNWHVLNDKRPDTGASIDPKGRTPDEVRILHNAKGNLGTWIVISEPLFDHNGQHLWIEHPLGRTVDVVFLPLTKTESIDVYPTDLNLRTVPIKLLPTGEVSIIGFPFGNTQARGLPIWKNGTIASDPDIDYADSPQILIDCTGRPGMSGSPVYARRVGGFLDETGGYQMMLGATDRFIGIYAGAIDEKSEIGRVWKASTILDIFNQLK